MRAETLETRLAVRHRLASWFTAALGAMLFVASSSASAHIALTSPPARYPQSEQKNPPCGHPDNPPGTDDPTVLSGGETIIVSIDEFIDHPSHFRIAIAPSDAEFVDPTDYDDFYVADNVVLDDIEDVDGVQFHEIELEVPDIDCDPCVMQVQQIMYSGAAFSQNALYYQCADIVIEASGAATTGGEDDTGDGGDETSGGDASAGEAGETSSDPSGSTGVTGDDDGPGTTEGNETSSGAGGNDDDDGCGCRTTHDRPAALMMLGLMLAGASLRRRPR